MTRTPRRVLRWCTVGAAMLCSLGVLILIPARAGAQMAGMPRPEGETGPSGKLAEGFGPVELPAAVVGGGVSDGVADGVMRRPAGPLYAGAWPLTSTRAFVGAEDPRPPIRSLGIPAASPRPDQARDDQSSAEISRMRRYLRDVAGPWTLVGTFVGAGVDHLRDVPEEWDQNLGGYGRRLASLGGRFAIQTTVTHGLAAAMDRPAAYTGCECSGPWQRVHHALLGTTTHLRPEGGRTLAVPQITGAYAGAFAQFAWRPGNADAGDALMSGTAFIVASAIQNLAREFLGAGIPILAH